MVGLLGVCRRLGEGQGTPRLGRVVGRSVASFEVPHPFRVRSKYWIDVSTSRPSDHRGLVTVFSRKMGRGFLKTARKMASAMLHNRLIYYSIAGIAGIVGIVGRLGSLTVTSKPKTCAFNCEISILSAGVLIFHLLCTKID